jgi:class 3 adenylate cyclase
MADLPLMLVSVLEKPASRGASPLSFPLFKASSVDLLRRKSSLKLEEPEFFSHAFGQAHDQLDHFFENSMRDLRCREIEIEGTVLTSQRRLMAMSEEAFLAGEADQKRVDLLASQKKKSELLLGHENEAKRQRQDAAAKTESLFVEASARKARSLKMQQLQETHELALALNRGAADRAPAFAREMAFLQRQQNDQREFIKETQSRRALNLELRQAAVRSTKKDVEARFLKREQDCEKQNLKEYGQREAEQLRSIQAIQLVQSQDNFDQREDQHRQTTQVQALHLTQKQELRAHHLEMKQTAKMSMLVKLFQVKEAERGRNSEIKTEKLLASQGIEAKQLLIAQQDARESRTAARTLDEKQTREAIKQASDSVSAQYSSTWSRKTSEVEGDRNILGADNSSFSAQNLLALAREVAFALQLKQDFERKNEDAKQRDEENEIILKRKEEVASEIEREKTMILSAKHQMEVDLAEISSTHAAEITSLDVAFTLRLGKLAHTQNNELSFQRQVYASELEEIQARAKSDMIDLKSAFPLERKYEQLLHQILPESIASTLACGQDLIALKHTQVTVIFVDLVDFTTKTNLMQPEDVVRMLNLIFGLLDDLCGELHLTKIKAIGDSYMCVANIPERQSRAVECAADFALRVVDLFRTNPLLESMMIRVGMAFGDVIAGVIGTKKPSYDVWGPIVNLASRMEHNSLPGKILVTHELAQILEGSFVLEQREKIKVKGCGMLTTHFLCSKRK